jgi:hypothetical protein
LEMGGFYTLSECRPLSVQTPEASLNNAFYLPLYRFLFFPTYHFTYSDP